MRHYHFLNISSTNDYAKELLSEEEIVIVTADYQSNGRGRNNKAWEGDRGTNLYCSVGISHKFAPDNIRITSYQALGCISAIKTLESISCRKIFKIKYPNDIYARDLNNIFKKICGVLIENSFVAGNCINSIIGIGINVAQKAFSVDLQNTATSLALLGVEITPRDVLPVLSENISKLFDLAPETLMDNWKTELAMDNKFITVVGDTDLWKVDKIETDGRLHIINQTTQSTRIIDNGDSMIYELN